MSAVPPEPTEAPVPETPSLLPGQREPPVAPATPPISGVDAARVVDGPVSLACGRGGGPLAARASGVDAVCGVVPCWWMRRLAGSLGGSLGAAYAAPLVPATAISSRTTQLRICQAFPMLSSMRHMPCRTCWKHPPCHASAYWHVSFVGSCSQGVSQHNNHGLCTMLARCTSDGVASHAPCAAQWPAATRQAAQEATYVSLFFNADERITVHAHTQRTQDGGLAPYSDRCASRLQRARAAQLHDCDGRTSCDRAAAQESEWCCRGTREYRLERWLLVVSR